MNARRDIPTNYRCGNGLFKH